MKIRKICAIVLIFTVLLSLYACRRKVSYKYMYDEDDIVEVHIVSFHNTDDGDFYTEHVKTIENLDAFMEDFNSVDCFVWWGDPTGIDSRFDGENIVKLIYSNGDYELINWFGQAEYTSDKGITFYAGIRIFDETQFKDLVSKYLA